MMKSFIGSLYLLFFSIAAFAQKNATLVGQQAPPVIFQQVFNAKVAPDFYKNKLLVLDFWATWCAPCIAAFPHFNQLSRKYGSDNVVFASITDEPVSVAAKFFKRTKKELDAIKLTDTTRKTGDSFQVSAIPYCVVIDKNNVVKWVGQSYDLTDATLSRIVNNQPAETLIAPVKADPKPQNKPIAQRALFSFSVARSDTTKKTQEGGFSRSSKYGYLELSIVNASLGNCLEQLTGFSKTARIVTNDSVKLKQLIDLYFKAGADSTLFGNYKNTVLKNAARVNMMLALLGQAFKFDTELSRSAQKHYELIITDTAKLHTFKSMQNGHSSFSDDYLPRFEIVGYSLKDITTNLEGSMKMAITTRITDKTHYDLSLAIGSVETANKTLQFHGLKLIDVNDEIEFLNINFY